MKKKRWVVGFIFGHDMEEVLLILKKRPQWQCGKANGIGGAIEEGETPIEAMRRECKEETDLQIRSWTQFCVLRTKGGIVYFFFSKYENFWKAKQMTDEHLLIAKSLKHSSMRLPNLQWLIPMAVSQSEKLDNASSFDVTEEYEK